MKLFESSSSLTMHNVTIVTRLRNPILFEKRLDQKSLKEKQISKSINKINNRKSNSSSKNKYTHNRDSKSPKRKLNANTTQNNNNNQKKGLTDNTLYTMFTSYQPCNLMLVSSKAIEGATINQAFQTRNNLYDFGKNFLKESALFEFDKIYNETHSLDIIYKDLIKENISNLFQKKNSCVMFYGPIDAGKSFLLRGGTTSGGNEAGLLSRAIRDIFRLISLYNQANNDSSSFHVKFCSYQIYLDNIHDLLSTESYLITVEKYLENNYVNTNLIGLTEKEIKNISEYENCMREALHNRATLSQKLKINDINRKSYFIISIRLEKKIYNKDGILMLNDNLKNFSRIDFVELVSSNFGQIDQISENDFTPKGMLYRNTDNVFNSICENIVCSCNCTTPNNDCSLTLALKNSINPESNIVFINCVIPWESPPNYSFKAVKFTNWLRNLVIEQNQNINKLQINNNNFNNISNNNIRNNNYNINELNNNNNISLNNQSIERLPSAQRNNAYGNNCEPKKNITIATNKINYLEKENDNNYYNLNTYQNKIDKNNGLFNNNIKIDYEEQVGNLTMLHNNPEMINMSNDTHISNNYMKNKINNQNANQNNEMNYSVNLPNVDKINTNFQTYLTQFPPKEQNSQNINNNVNQNRTKHPIGTRNNMALLIKDNPEEEIKSLRDRVRKKYKSPVIEKNNNQNYSENNIMIQNNEEIPIKNYERIQTYQRLSDNNNNNNNNSFIKMNNSNFNKNMTINNSNDEINNYSKMANPQEIKIKELEDKLKFLEEKSFENTQKLEEIRVNRETTASSNINNNINGNNTNNNNYNNNMNNVTVSYLPDAEVEKIKQEQATLKSDNIIFREDINRLTDINHHLENELIEQRNRNIELANENEQLTQEKSKIEKELKEARETIDKTKLNETSLEQYYNERLMLQNRMRDNENELKKTLEEKSKYEIDFKVLQSRFTELQNKYDKINDEYNNSKQIHDDELNKIEDKIDKLTREIEKLQGENNGLRQDNERQRVEINSLGAQRDNYREKYEEQKNKNDLLCGKIGEIENEFRNLQKDKNNEIMNQYKIDEHKRNRNESKTKIISELQEKIKNYRNQRMMKKKDEDEEEEYQ